MSVSTLLIVEDERWEREGLLSLIDRERFGIGRVLIAADGVEGLEILCRETVDILITDIRMPGLSGLDMIEQARPYMEHCVVIVLSGYTDFEYARKALRMNAIDYLLKPVQESELNTILEKATALLYGAAGRPLNTQDISGLFEGAWSAQEVEALCGVTELAGLHVAAITPPGEGPALRCLRDDVLYGLLRPGETLPEGEGVFAGIAPLKSVEDFPAAAHRARLAMENARFRQLPSPLNAELMQQAKRSGAVVKQRQKLALQQSLVTLEEERVHQAFSAIAHRLTHEVGAQPKQVCEEVAALLQEAAPDALAAVSAQPTLAALLSYTLKALTEAITRARRALTQSEAYVLNRLIAVVDQNYQKDDLNMQTIADQLFMTSNYIGALFKRSSGVTFKDYLRSYRLLKAAALFSEQNLHVSDVATAVGIPNVSYFCVQFRHLFGVTPSNYRRLQ